MNNQRFLKLLAVASLLHLSIVASFTEPGDTISLMALKEKLKNIAANWEGDDPCGDRWEGIGCINTRVTSIELPSMQLAGEISGDISTISELESLDLSYNKELGGPLPASIGDLKKLKSLMVVDCRFSGRIPDSIGSLQELEILALNSNKFSGSIPPSIGNLSKLTWLDLTDNKIDGSIPVSSGTTLGLGLDKLFNAKHFHLGKNQLSGEIPPELFSSKMTLIHLILDNNNLSGDIPSSIGLMKTLEVISFDNNSLTGPVPTNFSNLMNLTDLYLSNNELAGPFPNLTGMKSLANLIMEHVQLQGQFQIDFSSLPNIETLVLSNNKLSGIFDISSSTSDNIQLIDLRNNLISDFKKRPGQNLVNVILEDNPFCRETGVTETYCTAPGGDSPFRLPNNLVPQCSHPYSGRLIFRVPIFLDSGNSTFLTSLKQQLSQTFMSFQIPLDSFSLSISTKDSFHCNSLDLNVCLSGQDRWNRTIISEIGSAINDIVLRNPFYFNSDSDDLEVYLRSSKSNSRIIIGAAVGGPALLLLLLAAGLYAYRQKKKAETEAEKNNPFAHWDSSKNSGAEVPRLKEAKSFSFEELKRYTNNFSEANEIGTGGYGKVYRGVLPSRQLVAIKRAQQVSMQGGVEFKNEIELLSRVHHKNLVSLLGFCFDRGEHMIVYEFVPNGSLSDSLLGKTGIRLDWVRRLKIALGAARGLAYMHELADPPIIHRDIKSNNILLDEQLVAKVADFGLSKPISDTGNGYVTTQVKGTMGYLDPEFYTTEKSDVYSFGVVMLELLTGRKPLQHGHYVVTDVRLAIDRTKDLYNLHELLDPSISVETTLTGLDKFVDLAMKCVEESGTDRPTMGEVVKEIEHIFQLAGLNPNVESASSSASYEEASKRSPRRHPYYGKDEFH